MDIHRQGFLEQHIPVQFGLDNTLLLIGTWQTASTGKPLLLQGFKSRFSEGPNDGFGRGKQIALHLEQQKTQYNKMQVEK